MNVLEFFTPVTTFIFDVDGVLTDGSVLLLENGMQARRMHVKDGLALQMAMEKGYRVVVISGARSEPVIHRLKYLGVEEIHTGLKDKLGFITGYIEKNAIRWEEVLYMGDDLPDLPVMEKAGVPCCPADAVMEIKRSSKYISPVKGGAGCVRDVIEKVMKLNNQWHYLPDITSR